MFLYLVRHAEAKTEAEDPARPLSEKGLHDIRKTASRLAGMGLAVDRILCSRKLRAKQTAEVLSEHLRPRQGVSETDGLAPTDDPGVIATLLQGMEGSLMLVGHLPHLERLASLLVCGKADKRVVSFQTAGAVCLGRDESGTWSFHWTVTPQTVS